MKDSKGIASIALIIIISVAAVGIGLLSDKYLGNDNPVEQSAEAVIKEETGITVDLSPNEDK